MAQNMNRRDFIRSAAGTAVAVAGLPYVVPASVVRAEGRTPPSERIVLGFIACGKQSQHLMRSFLNSPGTQVVAACDVDKLKLERSSKGIVEKHYADRGIESYKGCAAYHDFRELLARPDIDAVVISTPDHWHAIAVIESCRAGKDVYCEKPLTHWTQFELAKKVEEAAEKNKRIVQVGTQYMADENYAKVSQMIKDGIIGKPVHCQLGYFRRGDWGERMPIPDPNAKPGPDLNWERFLGDAPKVPYTVSRFFQWRLYWDYAGGPATDLLVHIFTPVFCLLALDYPTRVLGGGGTFQYDREVPDQCNIIADYKDGPSVVMMNSLSNYTGVDTKIRGTNGIIILDDAGIRIVPIDPATNKETAETRLKWNGMGDTAKLWKNLLDCVKTREQPFSPISAAVRVQAPLNMGILSERENKVAKFNFDTKSIELS
jgi:predicted dehydrogenase